MSMFTELAKALGKTDEHISQVNNKAGDMANKAGEFSDATAGLTDMYIKDPKERAKVQAERAQRHKEMQERLAASEAKMHERDQEREQRKARILQGKTASDNPFENNPFRSGASAPAPAGKGVVQTNSLDAFTGASSAPVPEPEVQTMKLGDFFGGGKNTDTKEAQKDQVSPNTMKVQKARRMFFAMNTAMSEARFQTAFHQTLIEKKGPCEYLPLRNKIQSALGRSLNEREKAVLSHMLLTTERRASLSVPRTVQV